MMHVNGHWIDMQVELEEYENECEIDNDYIDWEAEFEDY